MSAPTIDELPVRVDFSDPSVRRRRRRRVLVVVAVALLAGAVAWLVLFSSVLAVSSVRVVGVDGVAAEQVLATATVPTGVPMVRVDTSAIQSRVTALPWLEAVEVRRGWPNEIVLAVSARVPIAVLKGTSSVVDASGFAFEALGAAPRELPSVSADGVALEAAMAVLAGLPADLAAKVESVRATTRDDVTMTLRSGAEVRWGSAEQADFKAEVLKALMKRKRDIYDVSAPELPTTFTAR